MRPEQRTRLICVQTLCSCPAAVGRNKTLAEVGLEAVQVASGERWAFQITNLFISSPAWGVEHSPLQVIHKLAEASEYSMHWLPEDAIYATTPSGYQVCSGCARRGVGGVAVRLDCVRSVARVSCAAWH